MIKKACSCLTVYMVSYFDRQQDVRATEIDKVDMHLSFRPGDIVRALVVLLLLDKKSINFPYDFLID